MKWRAGLLALLLLVATGCGTKETPEAAYLLKQARQASNDGDYKRALTMLKKILNDYPSSREARFAAEEYDTLKNLFQYEVEAQKQAVVRTMKKIGRAVEIYRQERNRLPASLADLVPRYLPTPPEDPWGNPIFYRRQKTGYAIACFGKDGLPGGMDEDRDLFVQNGQIVPSLILTGNP